MSTIWFRRRRDEKQLGKEDSWKWAIIIPTKALIGLNSKYAMKRKYCLCCHAFDSKGREIHEGGDDLTTMSKELIILEKQIQFKDSQIASLQHDNQELLKTRGAVVDEVADSIQKISKSTTVPRTRYYREPYPSEPMLEEEEE